MRENEIASEEPRVPTPAELTDDDRDLLAAVRVRFEYVVGGGRPLFETDVEGLWALFLRSIPAEVRPVYACRACESFVERFGGLVAITDDGVQVPVFWYNSLPPESFFGRALAALCARVSEARVSGVFLSEEATLGLPMNESPRGTWRHFSVSLPDGVVFRRSVKTADQTSAEKKEDRAILSRSLAEFGVEVARNACDLISTDAALYRSAKVAGPASWFLALHERIADQDKKHRENMVWLAVATAPPGFCHVRTTMIGTLLDDLKAGLDFAAVKERFDRKMDPMAYQRPQVAPRAGQVEQAERAVAALGISAALPRRFARLEDLRATWLPRPIPATAAKPSAGSGVFSHLKASPGEPRPIEASTEQKMTWERFSREVLPGALRIEYGAAAGRRPYIALTTSVDPEAPPILQWDEYGRRNPVSWYVYRNRSTAAEFNLSPETWVDVDVVCLLPPMWGLEEARPHWGEGVIFVLRGAKDLRATNPMSSGGYGFFPEQLRAELHPYRATLEAYAANARLAGGEEDCAAGLDLRKGHEWDEVFRVTSSTGGRRLYRLDRWA